MALVVDKFMASKITHILITLLLLIALSYIYVQFKRVSEHNEYHRSKMAQYSYLLILLNRSNNDIGILKSIVPNLKKESEGYLIPVQFVEMSKYILDGDYKLLDFYGYYIEANEEGLITSATLYKP